MARAGRPTRLRIQGRLRDRLSAGEGTRICRRDVQAYPPEGERRPFGRGSAGRAESRLLGDRLYRPVARAAEAAHGAPGQVRLGLASRNVGTCRRGYLRAPLAMLGE